VGPFVIVSWDVIHSATSHPFLFPSNYSPKSNEKLLFGYGFVLDDSKFDRTKVRVGGRWHLLRACQVDLLQKGFGRDHELEFGVFPIHLLAVIRVLVARDDELQRCLKWDDAVDGVAPLGRRVELKALVALREMLEAKLGGISKHDHALGDSSSNGDDSAWSRLGENLARYKAGQRAVLNDCHNQCLAKLLELDSGDSASRDLPCSIVDLNVLQGNDRGELNLLLALSRAVSKQPQLFTQLSGSFATSPLWNGRIVLRRPEVHEQLLSISSSVGAAVVGIIGSEWEHQFAALRAIDASTSWDSFVLARLCIDTRIVRCQGDAVLCVASCARHLPANSQGMLSPDKNTVSVPGSERNLRGSDEGPDAAPQSEPDLMFLYCGVRPTCANVPCAVPYPSNLLEHDQEDSVFIYPDGISRALELVAEGDRENMVELLEAWANLWAEQKAELVPEVLAPFVEAERTSMLSCLDMVNRESGVRGQENHGE
jgi:hypothetical protein